MCAAQAPPYLDAHLSQRTSGDIADGFDGLLRPCSRRALAVQIPRQSCEIAEDSVVANGCEVRTQLLVNNNVRAFVFGLSSSSDFVVIHVPPLTFSIFAICSVVSTVNALTVVDDHCHGLVSLSTTPAGQVEVVWEIVHALAIRRICLAHLYAYVLSL